MSCKVLFTQAGVAQLVEHLIRNEGVVSSSLITGTMYLVNKNRHLAVFYFCFCSIIVFAK